MLRHLFIFRRFFWGKSVLLKSILQTFEKKNHSQKLFYRLWPKVAIGWVWLKVNIKEIRKNNIYLFIIIIL